MRHDVAEQASAALYDASRKMDSTLMLIMEECSDEEFRKYRRPTGYAMGNLYLEVIRRIEREHPDLEPEEMRDRSPDDYPPKNPVQRKSPPDKSGAKMKRHVAEKALPALFAAAAEMHSTLILIQKECAEEELGAYREGMALAMGYLYNGLIYPILREHPDLTPEVMK
jgi:hypothetical protein